MTQVPQSLPQYEAYALRYARMPRQRRDNFLGGDPHDGPMPMDFYVWSLRARACGASGYRLRRGHGRQPQARVAALPDRVLVAPGRVRV